MTLTLGSLGLLQEQLTLKTDVYLSVFSLFDAEKNGCDADSEAAVYIHGSSRIYARNGFFYAVSPGYFKGIQEGGEVGSQDIGLLAFHADELFS